MGNRIDLTPVEMINFLHKRKCHFHHEATVQGYIPQHGAYLEEYDGKFGKGYIFHLPTRTSLEHKTTRYHGVEYWLIDPEED